MINESLLVQGLQNTIWQCTESSITAREAHKQLERQQQTPI